MRTYIWIGLALVLGGPGLWGWRYQHRHAWSTRTLTQRDSLLLGNRRQDADHSFREDAGAVEKLLPEATVVDSGVGEPLEVVQRLHGPLAAESVKAPEQKAVKLTLGCRREHGLKLHTIAALAAGPIHVLMCDLPVLSASESPLTS
jgi:hypothetical protein